jgi:hypothetical protein
MLPLYALLIGVGLLLWRALMRLDQIVLHYRFVDTVPNGASPAWSVSELYSLLGEVAQAQRLYEKTWLKDNSALNKAKARGDHEAASASLARAILRQERPTYLRRRFAERLQDNVAVSRGERTVVEARERDAEGEKLWRSNIFEGVIPEAERLHRIECFEDPIPGVSTI